MPPKKQKLELTWIGKVNRPKLEPRILVEDPEKSCHAPHHVGENDLFDNKLIFGDNLLALKPLEQEYAGKVKCVFIDPPYNTGVAFDEYQPDFVAETATTIYMLEPKRRTALDDPDVIAKREAAEQWCENATNCAAKHNGKPWIYRLIPHDAIMHNMSLDHLVGQ